MIFDVYEAVFTDKREKHIPGINVVKSILEKAYNEEILHKNSEKMKKIDIEKLLLSKNSDIANHINKLEISNKTRVIKKLQKYRNDNILYNLKEKLVVEEEFVEYFRSFNVDDIEEFILDNTYLLARFNVRLEAIQELIKIDDNNKKIYDVLKEICNSYKVGHAFINKEELDDKINITYDDCLNKLVEDKIIIVYENRIYLKEIYEAEQSLILNLKLRLNIKVGLEAFMENKIKDFIKLDSGFKVNDEQEKAIYNVFENKLSIITGPPGSGKSTLIKKIIECINHIHNNGKSIKLVAYTGKAVSRLNNEHMDVEAKTIHSFLGLAEDSSLFNCKLNKDSKKTDYLIIDESSMLDIVLLNLLLTSVMDDTNIILLGDMYQLQPIGVGEPFCDLIQSNRVAKTELNTIYRYKENSSIFNNANAIKSEQIDDIKYDDDFSFIEVKKSDEIVKKIKKQHELILSQGYKDEDIIIISATKKTIENINKSMSEELSKDLIQIHQFNIGDKVIQTKNDYKNNIFNGDVGIVTSIVDINEELELTVEFEDKVKTYSKRELRNLKLAYAITIHKVQGSEYKVVIIILDNDELEISNNNLLYVAVTRAREKVIIIGNKKSLHNTIKKHNIKKNSIILEQLLK